MDNFEMVGLFIGYLAAGVFIVSVPLMLLNFLFEYLKDRRRAGMFMTVTKSIGKDYKRLTMDTIKEINKNIWNLTIDEDEDQ